MTTSDTLLGELKGDDRAAAWEKFVHLYTPLLYSWLKSTGLQDADAADLLQDTFRVLVVRLPEFEYDRSGHFRGWLRSIALNLWRDHCRRHAKQAALVADLDDRIGQDDLFSEVQYRQQVLARAMELLRPEFEENTWQAFVRHGVESRPATDVATELNMSVGAVYSARCRVVARIRAYLAGLLDAV